MSVTADDMIKAILSPLEEAFDSRGLTVEQFAESAALRKKLLNQALKDQKKATPANLKYIKQDREEDQHLAGARGWKAPEKHEYSGSLTVEVLNYAEVQQDLSKDPESVSGNEEE